MEDLGISLQGQGNLVAGYFDGFIQILSCIADRTGSFADSAMWLFRFGVRGRGANCILSSYSDPYSD